MMSYSQRLNVIIYIVKIMTILCVEHMCYLCFHCHVLSCVFSSKLFFFYTFKFFFKLEVYLYVLLQYKNICSGLFLWACYCVLHAHCIILCCLVGVVKVFGVRFFFTYMHACRLVDCAVLYSVSSCHLDHDTFSCVETAKHFHSAV